jgi:hypothetical protein
MGAIINCLIESFWVGWRGYSDCEPAEIKLNCPVVYVTIYVSLRVYTVLYCSSMEVFSSNLMSLLSTFP